MIIDNLRSDSRCFLEKISIWKKNSCEWFIDRPYWNQFCFGTQNQGECKYSAIFFQVVQWAVMCVSCCRVQMEELIVKKCRKCGVCVCAEKGNRIENDCIFRQRTFFIWKHAILPCAHNKYKPSAHFKRFNESFNLFDFYLFYFSCRFRSFLFRSSRNEN